MNGCLFNLKVHRDEIGKDSRTDVEESLKFGFTFFLRAVINQSSHNNRLKAQIHEGNKA